MLPNDQRGTFIPLQHLPGSRMHMVFNLASLLSSPSHSGSDRYHFLPDAGGKPDLITFKGPLRAIEPTEGNDAITGSKWLSDETSI